MNAALGMAGGDGAFEWEANQADGDGEFAAIVSELPLRCVSHGTPDDCACRSRIAREVVARAWARELEVSGDREARFFHFIADGGVWMAYGLSDGDVRGVYCPGHNSQRAERSRAAVCSAGDVAFELPLAA